MQGITSGFLYRLGRMLSILAVLVLFPVISFNSPFTAFYVTFLLFAGPWFFPLLTMACILTFALGPLFPAPLDTIFIVQQAVIVIVLAVLGRLVRNPEPDTWSYRVLLRTGRALRFAYLAAAIIVLVQLALFRSAPVLWNLAWSVSLCAFISLVAWPKPSSVQTWETRAVNVVLMLVSVALSAAGLEYASRFMFEAPVIQQPGRGVFEANPDYLWTLKRNSTFEHTTTPETGDPEPFLVEVSSQGVRDREFGPKKPNEFRIAMVGDSLAMGWGSLVEKAPPRALERALQGRNLNRDISVINMGVAGFGPWQERLFFLERGLPLEPDLVVLELYPENDVHNTLTRTGKYLQCYNKGWEDIVLYWRFQSDWRMQAEWWLREHSRLYSQVSIASNASIDLNKMLRNLRFLEPLRMPKLPPQGPRPFQLEFMMESWYPGLETAWTMMKDDVRKFAADCRNRNITVVVFCLPSWSEVFDSSWQEKTAEAKEVRYERNKDVRLCEEFLHVEGIPFVNVSNTLSKDGGVKGAYLNDGHLSELGANLLADVIAEYLVTKILPESGVYAATSGNS